jgi:hypothetical protein
VPCHSGKMQPEVIPKHCQMEGREVTCTWKTSSTQPPCGLELDAGWWRTREERRESNVGLSCMKMQGTASELTRPSTSCMRSDRSYHQAMLCMVSNSQTCCLLP